MNSYIPSAFAAFLSCGFASGAVTIHYSNDNAPGFELKYENGIPLSSGMPDNMRDGTALALGYYSLATTADPFTGEWIVMVGVSNFHVVGNYITIGDHNVDDAAGVFQGSTIIGPNPSGRYALPAVGTPLAIRFYDRGDYVPTKHLFNAVSSIEWVWPGETPDSTMVMDLTTDVLLWQGGESSAFRTTLPVPETSASLLAMLGGGAFFTRRRRSELRRMPITMKMPV